MDLIKQKSILMVTHIYTHTHIHVCKSSHFFILFPSANNGCINSIDFPNTSTHGRTNHFYRNGHSCVFYIHTHVHKMNIVFSLFLSCLLALSNCLFLDIYCCHNPFVYVLVKFVFCLFLFFSLFNGISTFVGYLMSKPSFKKNNSGTI